jgi:metal-responsive CopG/Arc/MetJ family transcriptional regulator
MDMKTAVSLPDDLFSLAEAAARRLRMSRSQLYATALTEYLNRQETDAITEVLNEVYSRHDAKVDPLLNAAQLTSVDPGNW